MRIKHVIERLNWLQDEGLIQAYAIGGAVGATFYLEPIATIDIDVFVAMGPKAGSALVDPTPMLEALRAQGYHLEGEYVVMEGWPVQFLGSSGSLVDEALEQARVIDIEGTPARVFTPEHLCAVALQTGRAKDFARVLQFLEEEAADVAALEGILARHGLAEKWQEFQRRMS
jgi:hypothetical protein